MRSSKYEEIWREISRIGKKLYDKGYMVSHAGNISIRAGNKIFIKRRGVSAGDIGPDDVVEVPLYGDDSNILIASSETYVHREIYKATSALAIIHAHPPFSVIYSHTHDELVPYDVEAEYFLHKVPIISVERATGSKALEDALKKTLRNYKACIVRGHGTFAISHILEEAFHITCMVEHAAFVNYFVDLSGLKSKRLIKELKEW